MLGSSWAKASLSMPKLMAGAAWRTAEPPRPPVALHAGEQDVGGLPGPLAVDAGHCLGQRGDQVWLASGQVVFQCVDGQVGHDVSFLSRVVALLRLRR